MCFQKQKSFVLKTKFSYMAKWMCEEVDEDSRHGARHVDIRVGMCILVLECVCLPLHVYLSGE